jgi:hypothetical protein
MRVLMSFNTFNNNKKKYMDLPMYFIIKKKTHVAHLMESHVRTFAHDSFEKACYFLLHLGKASTFWLHLRIFSLAYYYVLGCMCL